MKTAILYSGHMRTFAKTYANHRWMLHRHFPDAHFFVSCVDDENAASAELLLQHHPADRVHIEKVKQPEHIPLPEGCPPEESWQRGTNFMHEPYAISVSPQGVLKQLWHLNRVWQFACDHGVQEFDCFARVRPDIWIHSLAKPMLMFHARLNQADYAAYPDNFASVISGPSAFSEAMWNNEAKKAFLPYWGRFGGCNDRLALLGALSARDYFTAFAKLDGLIREGCPLHPESIIKAAIELGGGRIIKLATEFSTIRNNGEVRGWMSETLPCDVAEGLS